MRPPHAGRRRSPRVQILGGVMPGGYFGADERRLTGAAGSIVDGTTA